MGLIHVIDSGNGTSPYQQIIGNGNSIIYSLANGTAAKVTSLGSVPFNVPENDPFLAFQYHGSRLDITPGTVDLDHRQRALLQQSLQEVLALSALEDVPNIIRSFGYRLCIDRKDRKLYFEHNLELIEGKDLSVVERQYSLAQKVKMIHDLSAAVMSSHQRGISHRDITPRNVLFDSTRERAVLTDFSLAGMSYEANSHFRTHVHSGLEELFKNHELSSYLKNLFESHRIIVGSQGYFSPEQIQGKEAGTADDIFATGLVSVEVLMRKPVFLIRPNNKDDYTEYCRSLIHYNAEDTRGKIIGDLYRSLNEQYTVQWDDTFNSLVDAIEIALANEPKERDLLPLQQATADFLAKEKDAATVPVRG